MNTGGSNEKEDQDLFDFRAVFHIAGRRLAHGMRQGKS